MRENKIYMEKLENCDNIRDLLSLYIDEMLDLEEMAGIKEHLATCDTCRKEYNELIKMVDLLKGTEVASVPEFFEFRLKRALAEEKKSSSIRKRNFRVISSITAIFAVGIITIGMYNDILGIIPDKIDLSDQTGIVRSEEVADSGSSVDDNVDYGALEPENIQYKDIAKEMLSDNSALDKNTADNKITADNQNKADNQNTAGISAMPDYDVVEESTSRELPSSNSDSLNKYKVKMPIQGVERNSAAISYYNKLIEEKLEGYDYQVTDCSYYPDGEWHFSIFIYKGKDGNNYNQEILIIGRNGEIEVLYANEFMGL